MTPLPIDDILPTLLAHLLAGPNAVLQAPPGAGKTTRVPLALLDQPWAGAKGRIILLEPRRLAARTAARRMAATLGEEVGETVGYRVRLDSKIGPRTRIEVVTEGVLIRQIQADPELTGVAAVLFDEFHERSLDGDLGLALCLEAQAALRDDLRLLVMSATLDGERVASLIGNAPILTSQGRAFPVALRWLGKPDTPRGLEDAMASAIRLALEEQPDGDVLAFLPGTAEIRRTAERLDRLPSQITLAPLYGDLTAAEQDRAIQPAPPGQRKIVLATSIAETSLTIEGVRIVVDCGLSRTQRFDPNTGMTRLDTVPVSQAAAEQRRGRAGRVAPGTCYRLWAEAAHGALPAFAGAEILEADLAPLALDLAAWGTRDPGELRWLDAPPTGSYAQAITLLQDLGALDEAGGITPHGQAMARLPMHPRLAHMVLTARVLGNAEAVLACDIAALLAERDPLRGQPGSRSADLRLRLEALYDRRGGGAFSMVRAAAQQWRRMLKLDKADPSPADAGLVLALAYPDRIGKRRGGGEAIYLLSGGRGASLPKDDPLAANDFLVAAHLDGAGRDARIRLATSISEAELELVLGDRIRWQNRLDWDDRDQTVQARRQRRLGALILKDDPLPNPPAEAVQAALLTGIRRAGLDCLPWTTEAEAWRARLAFLHRHDPKGNWPDVSDDALLAGLEEWLAPALDGMSRFAHFRRLDLLSCLHRLLDWSGRQELDKLVPSHITVPSGSRIPIQYDQGDEPVLAVRLQEMFGLTETPRILRGAVPVLLHLLSPARRPVQVTRDLASFWTNAYLQVKADLKGQYPKHYWPDNPLEAEPTARAKPRQTAKS